MFVCTGDAFVPQNTTGAVDGPQAAGSAPPWSAFNRAGKGTHRAGARYESLRDRYRYVLRGDVFRYFPAIDHEVLKADLRRRIGCERTRAVLDRIVDASNPQEPVHLYYPGDDLFTPYARRRGLPIGNLTSQLFANVYLDHFVTEVLRAPYLRCVDRLRAVRRRRWPTAWRRRKREFGVRLALGADTYTLG